MWREVWKEWKKINQEISTETFLASNQKKVSHPDKRRKIRKRYRMKDENERQGDKKKKKRVKAKTNREEINWNKNQIWII